MMVKWILVLSAAVVVSICSADRVEEVDEMEERRSRNLRNGLNSDQEWKAIDTSDSPEWIPHPNHEETDDPDRPPLKRRRRIRKRKRRPPPPAFDEYDDYASLRRRRRKRPQRLDDVRDGWSAIENESYQRPHKRRRIYPTFYTDASTDGSTEERPPPRQPYEKVRDPFTALAQADVRSQTHRKPNQVADVSDTEVSTEEDRDYATSERSSSAERPPAGTETALNDIQNNTQEQSVTVAKYEIVTEPVTEKRIFVPAHPQLYTTFKYKPDIDVHTKPTTETSTTTTKSEYGNKIIDQRTKYQLLKPKLKMASVNPRFRTTPTSPTTETPDIPEIPEIPEKPETPQILDIAPEAPAIPDLPPVTIISIPEDAVTIHVGDALTKSPKPSGTDGPVRMVIDIDDFLPKGTITPFPLPTTLEPQQTTIRAPVSEKVYATTIPSAVTRMSSAKEEIMEVLRDHSSRQNLSRILQVRNMTVDELVAQRERGSSQLHLADIFHNQTREPEPPSEPFVGIPFLLNPFGRRRSKALDDVTPAITDSKSRDEYVVTNFPKFRIEKTSSVAPPTPSAPSHLEYSIWKTLYPSLNEELLLANSLHEPKSYQRAREILENEVRKIENVENKISDVVNDRLNVDVPRYANEDYLKLPSGVKSAIIASFAIIGISLLVFLTIFVVFKWSQKQRKRLCYARSFSCGKIKAPILEEGRRKTLKTFVSETLGRKRKYKNMYPHNISDYGWDPDKKPFQ